MIINIQNGLHLPVDGVSDAIKGLQRSQKFKSKNQGSLVESVLEIEWDPVKACNPQSPSSP